MKKVTLKNINVDEIIYLVYESTKIFDLPFETKLLVTEDLLPIFLKDRYFIVCCNDIYLNGFRKFGEISGIEVYTIEKYLNVKNKILIYVNNNLVETLEIIKNNINNYLNKII